MENIMLPMGVRRDGSYYTRIEWAAVTESDPTFWVCNVISDDHERNGGTYGACVEGLDEPKNDVVLSFFGELQTVSKIRLYKNVGVDISVPEELAKHLNIYVSATDEPLKLRRKEDDINSVDWKLVKSVDFEKEFGWQDIELDAPAEAKFLRFEFIDNFCGKDNFIPWVETSEIKIYP